MQLRVRLGQARQPGLGRAREPQVLAAEEAELAGWRCRGCARCTDTSEHFAHVHGVALGNNDLHQHASCRRGNFAVDLVGRDLEETSG